MSNTKIYIGTAALTLSFLTILLVYMNTSNPEESKAETAIRDFVVGKIRSRDDIYIAQSNQPRIAGYCVLGPYSRATNEMQNSFGRAEAAKATKRINQYSTGPRSEFIVVFTETGPLIVNFYNEKFSFAVDDQTYCRKSLTQPIPYVSNLK